MQASSRGIEPQTRWEVSRLFAAEIGAVTNPRGFGLVGRADVTNVGIFCEHLINLEKLGVRHPGGEIDSRLLEALNDKLGFFWFHSYPPYFLKCYWPVILLNSATS
jgi:hypothetical protein